MNRALRQPIVAGNWKMNTNIHEGSNLTEAIAGNESVVEALESVEVVLFPPFTHLVGTIDVIADLDSGIMVGAQNCHQQTKGAFTGEISPSMISSTGASFCLVGHSERRQYFQEDNALLAQKVNALLSEGLTPIYCCGETQEERESGRHFDVITTQIQEGLLHLSSEQFESIVIAYEPVWAIGTGLTASAEQAQEIHGFIRKLLTDKYGESVAERTRILYGGSVKPNNAQELFQMPDIDGGLIGGASLVAEDFVAIIAAGAHE